MGQKSKAKKLTDAICRDLPRLDKKYYKPGDYPGLQFWVRTSGTKTWYYQYRTKHKKFPQRKRLETTLSLELLKQSKEPKIYQQKFIMVKIQKKQKKLTY